MKFKTIVFLFLVVCTLFLPSTSAENPYIDWSAYSTVTMNVTPPEDEFQVRFTNDTFTIPLVMWNEMDQTGKDTRILNYNHTIEFPFWIEHLTARDNYSIWVNVTDNTSATYQWYYGNPSVSSDSDGDATFPLFDNFGGFADTSKYTVSAQSGRFESYGFVFKLLNGTLMHIYTNGTQHDYETIRKIVHRTSTDSGVTWSSESIIYDNNSYDHRNLAGGITSNGSIVVFMSRYDSTNHKISFIRSVDNGSTWTDPVDIEGGANDCMSPHGQMVNVPGKGLMQSYYVCTSPYRVKIVWSYDDGVTWGDEQEVYNSSSVMLTECSFQYVGDGNIIGLSRRDSAPTNIHQFNSTDSGTTWQNESTGVTEHDGPVWIQNFTHESVDKLILIYMNAGSLELKYRIANVSDVFSDATHWQSSDEKLIDSLGMYQSTYYDDSYPVVKVVYQNTVDKHLYIKFVDMTEDQSIDTTKWTTSGVVNQTSGILTGNIESKLTFGTGYALRTNTRNPNCVAANKYLAGWGDQLAITNWIYYRTSTGDWMKEEYDGSITSTGLGIAADTDYHIFDVGKITGTAYYNRDGNDDGTLSTGAINNANKVVNYNVDTEIDWSIVRKFAPNAPIVNSISEPKFYTNSLHYNSSSPYNHTIESDGTLTANRSITVADDTNDTAQSTDTSYLIINIYDNTADIVRNVTFTGDNLDWYQAANLSGTYDLKNSSGIIETQDSDSGLVKFTTNLTAGTYWIEKTGISISLVSFTPTPLNTNYTGVAVISYMVKHPNPLNLSSLAFLYGLNYTTTGDMHNYIAMPPNDIASEGIYLAPNRNVTPYLSWEFNDTITESNVWQWGGGDNNSWWIEKNPVNATHTYINATGATQHIFPSSFYIQKLAMYNAPKTGFEINRQQGLIFKMWNVEQLRDRNFNYFANLYFDSSWESTLPTYPIEIGFCNNSYNPAVDDIDTCLNCTKFGEWNGTRWVNHSWIPGANASYAYPMIINGSQYTVPVPDEINYIWLRSNTLSSKSYVLNATDSDPGITNITFAQTETMWTYNELNGVTSPAAYTPSFFTTFVRNDEELLHHLYIADESGVWGHSDIFSESIGISSVPVPPVSFEYFNVTCDESYHDEEMDATYDQGTVGVGIHCPSDPDGTTVSHNLTLHYYPNLTLVAVINDTFTTTGDENIEIEFTTTPYYSPDTLYTLKCVSKDGDDNVATKWLISYFALDADGNQGWVKDDKLLFWGMNDIPTLYSEVSNSSLISYDGGSDVYTMHIPFFKSKANDTFNFNETVHLESLNNEDVAYFRFTGRTKFDNAPIIGWNTTAGTPAPITDEYRAYVYSLTMTCENITNSNFSYLGSDFYRQEGLNFVENSHEYLIHNTTFSHNAEGPIFEECSNFTISNCTISDNVNVGIGVYFSDNYIIENNTISSNGGRSITLYESNNNIINYNDITNSGVHGIHYWSNSINNTCTGNDISGSALYDYYLSSSSTGNFIIDPVSTTDRIRVTSTSSVNIENTDNAAFSEDSLNTSYAYLTNFSMFVSGVSQTFDITQRDMTVLPSIDKVAILNLEWDTSVKFNATSDTDINPTWFNITKSTWSNKTVYVYRNDTLYTNENANATGVLLYNYSESLTEKWFEFRTTLISLGVYVPLSIFMFMGILLFVFAGASFYFTGVFSIFTSLLSVMFAFIMSKITVNGTLIQNIGGFDSTGTVVQAVTIIEMPALSYILLFIGLFMVVILIIQVMREIKFRESQDIIELDL